MSMVPPTALPTVMYMNQTTVLGGAERVTLMAMEQARARGARTMLAWPERGRFPSAARDAGFPVLPCEFDWMQNPKGDPNEVHELFSWQRPFSLTSSRFGPAPLQPTHDNWGPLVIPAGKYMMLGDNRYNSKDSRYWGFVPRNNVRGEPIFVYYSYDPEGGSGVCPLTDIRWSRIGHLIR